MKRQAQTGSLSFKQRSAHTMHADAVVLSRDRCQQRRYPIVRRSLNLVERETTVFSCAPRHQDWLHVDNS